MPLLVPVGHAVYARHQFAQNVGQRKDVAQLTSSRSIHREFRFYPTSADDI